MVARATRTDIDMVRPTSSNFLLSAVRGGWRLWVAWIVCIGTVLLLGALRLATDAELVLASLALLPVLVIAWIAGRTQGLLAAILASAMWAVGDLSATHQFSAPWIPWVNAATHLMTYGLVALLAAQVRGQLQREHEQASQDALTKLANRRAFLEAGAGEVERSKRYGHSMAVIFLDLDNFKQLNDARGHAAGDAALQATARALLGALRSSDQVARLGGDEFAVLLPEIGYDAAVEAGHKVSLAINKSLKQFAPVTVSVGVAWFDNGKHSFATMLKAADELMYEVKQGGKNDMRAKRFGSTKDHDTEG